MGKVRVLVELQDRSSGSSGTPVRGEVTSALAHRPMAGDHSWAMESIHQELLLGDTKREVLDVYGVANAVDSSQGALPAEPCSEESCAVCLSAERDTIALPCRHCCTCADC